MGSISNLTITDHIQEEQEHPSSSPSSSSSSLLIVIVVISALVGLSLLVLAYFLVRRMKVKKNKDKIETSATTSRIKTATRKKTKTAATTKNEKQPVSLAPITSSLDTNEIFFSILEHPPKPLPLPLPPPIVRNHVDPLSPAMFEEGYCLHSTFMDVKSLHSDPVSASLARQREDRRMSYYLTPSLSQTKLNDEKQIMRRLSVSSYQVW